MNGHANVNKNFSTKSDPWGKKAEDDFKGVGKVILFKNSLVLGFDFEFAHTHMHVHSISSMCLWCCENEFIFLDFCIHFQVAGKRFRHEKTKKKRGSYTGGRINTSVNSMKFDDGNDDDGGD